MKTKFTNLVWGLLAFLILGFHGAFAGIPKADNPNFRYIDDFEAGVNLWWTPEGSGSTIGIILEEAGVPLTYREAENDIVNPATGSTGSMKLAYMWDTEIPIEPGAIHHLIRQHLPANVANVAEKRFLPDQAIEVFVYGDGSGNKFRLMTRETINNQLEGTPWMIIDWVGWKRITWRLSEDPVVGWVNGDGEWSGNEIYFDSFQITWSGQAAGESGVLYFDDLRIVDPFDVEFVAEDADGAALTDVLISINGTDYEEGLTNFELFPGEYQFFVKKEGFITSSGSFIVDDADLSIEVTLDEGDDPEYLLSFNVFNTEGELITYAVINLNGTAMQPGEYIFEVNPGFYNYEVSLSGYYPYEGMATVVDANVFINVELILDPAIFNNIFLSWEVAATADVAQYRAEHYSVWIAPVSLEEEEEYIFNPDDFTIVFEETLDTENPAWEFQSRSIEISDFHNSDIRIAFRHHDSNGMERLIIDNVEITAIRTGDIPMIVLYEDFEGGVVDPINTEWLPNGWMVIDLGEDGKNWYFGVREENGYMASRSRLANNDPLEPDNWLIIPETALPLALFYNINFVVKDQDENLISDAVITINNTILEPGEYIYSAPNGTYAYSVAKEGYEGTSGEVTIEGAHQTVEVTLTQILHQVEFKLDTRYDPDFEAGMGTYYITGSFPGIAWAEPGTMESEQLMDPTDNVFIFTLTKMLPAGTFEYKYFNGSSWNDGEWPGGDNRILEVIGPMEVIDWFGYLTDPTMVPITEEVSLNLFPNPVKTTLTVESGEMIRELRLIDMLGQVIYSSTVLGNRFVINVSQFKNGIYFVHILTSNGLQTRKLQILK